MPPSTTASKRDSVRARLARAHGHLHGVMDMMDEGRPDWEVLQQIVAVRAALDKATAEILDDMITRAQTAPRGSGGRAALDELRQAVHALK